MLIGSFHNSGPLLSPWRLVLEVVEREATWKDYQRDLLSHCCGAVPIQLDQADLGQACFVIPDYGTDAVGMYTGLQVNGRMLLCELCVPSAL